MNLTSSSNSGYMSKMGYDSEHPYCNLPYSYSGSSSTYYCDYCYLSSGDIVLCVGGFWRNDSSAGLCYWFASCFSSGSNSDFGCLLSYKPV